MLSSKSPYQAPHSHSHYRTHTATDPTFHNSFASPTDSEFSVGYDELDSIVNWDSKKVGEWLRSINAGQYVELFKANDITGPNLMDIDQTVLKEMGVKKVGDRVRIGAQVKLFRFQHYSRKRRSKESMVTLHNQVPTPPSSDSPRPVQTTLAAPVAPRGEKRSPSETRHGPSTQHTALRTGSRPASPFSYEGDQRSARPARVNALSPREAAHKEQTGTYFAAPSTVPSPGRETPQTARFATSRKPVAQPGETAQTAHFGHSRASSLIVDTEAANIGLDGGSKSLIRVIYDNARSSVFSVEGCKNAEEVILKTLKKGFLNEGHVKSYCFYVLDGTAPNPAYCRRLSESELMKICSDPSRLEKGRLIFRKIHAGEPEGTQLQSAAAIALAQLQKLTGESLPAMSYPMSPASVAERQRHLNDAAKGLEGGEYGGAVPRPRTRKVKELHGSRPPSELVVADPKTYFPDVDEDKIDNLRRMSVRRSQRVSRAQSHLSVASNVSFTSSLDDAPPLPRISDSHWFNNANGGHEARPLSILGGPRSSYRESYAQSELDVLDEEASEEPDRKSYVSFSEGSPESAVVAITDADGNKVQKSYFEELGGSLSLTDANSLNEQLTQAIAEDGEEQDDELVNFLRPEAFDDIKHIRGKLIGQGSFGSVYLALHAVTAELMAVKQVELPSTEGTAVDAKKNNMVEALKREIALLRDLKHPHIVQYLGSSSDANNLNIFLEYVPGGSIAKMLVDFGSLNENQITKLVPQILIGLAFLHSKDIIHRDIKGANILVDNKGAVKISDFGISKRVQDSKTLLSEGGAPKGRGLAANRVSLQGSVFWMAPEVVRQTSYTRKADIWSLGCLVIEMLTGSHPHPNMSQLQAIFKIGGKGAGGAVSDPAPELPGHASKDAKEFLTKTFAIEYEQRPEADELLQMAFLKGKY